MTETSQVQVQAQAQAEESILRDFEDNQISSESNLNKSSMKKMNLKLILLLTVVAVSAGVGTGFGVYSLQANASKVDTTAYQQVAEEGSVKVGDIFGIKDDSTFKDSAEGYLDEGDPDLEGSHRLVRPGGETQTVYLTSSVTDLDKFIGMQVQVKGETFKGQKVGWLMDVGQVEVLELDAEAPVEE
jgi:hypothetical protein